MIWPTAFFVKSFRIMCVKYIPIYIQTKFQNTHFPFSSNYLCNDVVRCGAVLTGARFICSVPYLFHRGSSAWPPYNTISVVISSWLDLKIKQLPQCDDEMFAFGTTFILTSKHICKKWMNDKIWDFPKIPTQKTPEDDGRIEA